MPGATAATSPTASPSDRPDPATVVRAYYTAISNGNFAKARALGGKNPGQNFAAFAAGLAQDANIGIMGLDSAGNTVTARTQEAGFDGESEVLSLTCTVVNGVITAVTRQSS